MKSYRELIVWQKSMCMVTEVYVITDGFPTKEMYGLANQVRKSAVSIPSNIAEGFGRGSTSDYIRFLRMSRGSLYELQTQMEIAKNIGYLDEKKCGLVLGVGNEIERMLNSLISKLMDKKG